MSERKNRAKLIEIYASDINQAVELKLQGISPLSLKDQGDLTNIPFVDVLFDRLNELDLMSVVDARVIAERERPEKTPIARHILDKEIVQPKGYPLHFASLDSENWGWGPPMTEEEHKQIQSLIQKDPEEFLHDLHLRYQSRSFKYRREFSKEVANDAAREWRELLRLWGVSTWSERRKTLSEKIGWYINLFKTLGLWEKILKDLDYETAEQIRQVMSQNRRIIKNTDSSDGLTLFASELAMAIEKVYDS